MAAAASVEGMLHAPVPPCPDWTGRDLVRHLGGVHRWATGVVAGPRTEPWDVDLDDVVGEWPDDGALVAWFQEGCDALVAALRAAPADLDCWTFLRAPTPLTMWSRRQMHETTVHRVDAELAAGVPVTRPEGTVAADGIDELLTCFITRRAGRLRADRPCSLVVRCPDADREWVVHIGAGPVVTDVVPPGDGHGDCVAEGPAADAYLALWNRAPLSTLEVAGDAAVLELFVDKVRVRWA